MHQFMAVQAELLAMIMRTVEAAGTSMAFPSTTAYLMRDQGIPGPEAIDEPAGVTRQAPDQDASTAGEEPRPTENEADGRTAEASP
jgi:hypothetical protein